MLNLLLRSGNPRHILPLVLYYTEVYHKAATMQSDRGHLRINRFKCSHRQQGTRLNTDFSLWLEDRKPIKRREFNPTFPLLGFCTVRYCNFLSPPLP